MDPQDVVRLSHWSGLVNSVDGSARKSPSANTRSIDPRRSSELANVVRKYRNRAIEAAQVIEEFIGLSKQMRESAATGRNSIPTDAGAGPVLIPALYRLIWPPVRRMSRHISLPEEIAGRLVMVLGSEWCLKSVT